ncbi:type VI immunity family protein [Melittangium boletus]|uniref:type VI immunity family protein n=1 Tax=Melittangium boletus TaxID=83453 RepID=UPI001FEAEB8E|nr:type VI immunity family protein [Melittangium boletus]
MREVIRLVFYMPYDHPELSAGVSHALDAYMRAVGAGPGIINSVYLSHDEDSPLSEEKWEHVHRLLRSTQEWSFPEGYEPSHRREIEKRGAERDILFTGGFGNHNGYEFEYRARIPWRPPEPNAVSLLSATLPTEHLEQHGVEKVRALVMDMASQLPFASGHAGLALKFYLRRLIADDRFRAEIVRYPGFDLRAAWPLADQMGSRIDGVHWLNFLANPVLAELGGAEELRSYLHSPQTTVREFGDNRVVIELEESPEAGDLCGGQDLPSYRELAQVLEPWLESLPPNLQEERGWWNRFLSS